MNQNQSTKGGHLQEVGGGSDELTVSSNAVLEIKKKKVPRFGSKDYETVNVESIDTRVIDKTSDSRGGQRKLENALNTAFELSKKESLNETVMAEIYQNLQYLFENSSQQDWKNILETTLQNHPLLKVVLEDPCTNRSRTKPRGYPGDAKLLDFFYNQHIESGSRLGREIFLVTVNRPSGCAIRERVAFLAKYIDDASEQNKNARILSIACGHLKEAELSKNVFQGNLDCILGIDHDPMTLENLRNRFKGKKISGIQASVLNLIKGEIKFDSQFDLAYSAGLFDYLNNRTAQRLLGNMFDITKPGGKVLVTNFDPSTNDIGYMESFMEWSLIYRNMSDMVDLSKALDFDQVENIRVFRGINQCINYLEITKKA